MNPRIKRNNHNTNSVIEETEETQNFCFYVVTEDADNFAWYIDSGASSHMTSNKNFFSILDNYGNYVTIASGYKINCSGIEEEKLPCIVSGNGNMVRVQTILYVPEIKTSLLSPFNWIFESEKCFIKSAGTVIAEGKIKKGL